MGVIKQAGNTIGGFFGRTGDMIGNATGSNTTGSVDQYQEFTPTMIDSAALRRNITDQASQLKDQNVAAFNSAVNGQRGISPALAAYLSGNNLAQANTAASQQATNTAANVDFQTQLANQQARANAHQMNQNSYYQSKGLNQNYQEGAANRSQATIGGMIGGAASALSSVAFSDERLKESISKEDYADGFPEEGEHEYHEILMGRWKPQEDGVPSMQVIHERGELAGEERAEHRDDFTGRTGNVSVKDPSVNEFLNSLTPHLYKYKEGMAGDDGGAPHLGIMAQNLEKTLAGQGIVKETQEGKAIDINQLAGSLAAGLGAVHRRLEQLEARRDKRKRQNA